MKYSITNGNKVIQTIQAKLTSEHSLVVVTHKPALLALVDRIIVINAQGIVMDGPKDSVLKQLNSKVVKKAVS